MALSPESQRASDEVREHIARSRALREKMIESGRAVSYHLRKAAEYQRQAIREARRRGRYY